MIQNLAADPAEAGGSGRGQHQKNVHSAEHFVPQLTPWPTTWSSNFSVQLHSISQSGAGSELNTEEQAEGRRQAELLNARLSTAMAADVLSSRD